MKTVTHSHAEHELTQLANRFDHWRQSRTTPRPRIPQPLWEQAVSLTAVLPVSRVAKRIRLSTHDLKKRCAAKPAARPAEGLPVTLHFVEVTPPSAWCPATAEIELQRPDGARMRMAYHHAHPPVASLVRAFLETP